MIPGEPHKITIGRSRRSSGMTVDIADDACSVHSETEFTEKSSQDLPNHGSLAERPLKSCLMSADPSSPAATKKTLRFDKVEFREYTIILSDNPCTSSGPPIGLGWSYDPKDTMLSDIDTYEDYRHFSGTRRSKSDLRIPAGVRLDIMIDSGYSGQTIKKACQQVKQDQERRYSSLKYKKYDMIFEGAEKLKRGAKKHIISPGNKTKESTNPRRGLRTSRDSIKHMQ